MPTVTLLLPTLNELPGFESIFPHIDTSLFDDILVVDGKSTDGTWQYALSRGLRVMTQLRKGLGPGVLDAVATITTDYFIEFSLDGNCLPEHLPALVAKLKEGYDVVVVSRYLPPAVSYDDSRLTAFGNWMFSKMIRFLGPFPVTDSLNIYRGVRTRLVQSKDFARLVRGPVFEPLTSALANTLGLKIFELAGDEPRRIGGLSKMSPAYNGSCILLMIIRCYLLKLGIRV